LRRAGGSANLALVRALSGLRVGYSPITFNNEDVAGPGAPVPYRSVLDHIASLGFTGTERGAHFPADPLELRREATGRGLTVVGGWCGLELASEESAETDLAHVRTVACYLSLAGATYVNLAHAGTSIRRRYAGQAADRRVPGFSLTTAEWSTVTARLHAAARICRQQGLVATFHPHVGTWIETRAELDELCRLTDPDLVQLCFDVGHAIYAGMDPYETIRHHRDRIRYVHVKDVSGPALERLRRERLGFEAGLEAHVFTELGRGLLDLARLREVLANVGYNGWLMVEQDTSSLAPESAARVSRDALRRARLWPRRRARAP
jgi:inosose dehydratase